MLTQLSFCLIRLQRSALVGIVVLLGASLKAMNNSEVIALVNAGTGDETIIAAITNAEEKSFDTDTKNTNCTKGSWCIRYFLTGYDQSCRK